MATLRLPLDYREAPSFRRLAAGLGGNRMWADWVLLSLWRTLGYLASEGGLPGKAREADIMECLAESEVWMVVPGEIAPAKTAVALKQLLATEEVGLLVADGEGVWYCPRFNQLHATEFQLAPSKEAKGGNIKAFNARTRPQNASADALFLSPDVLVDAAGQPLSSETVRRYSYLVRVCDNALFRGERPAHRHTASMVANALPVLAALTDEQIAATGRTLALHRGHPLLATLHTEQLLPEFREIAGKLGGRV